MNKAAIDALILTKVNAMALHKKKYQAMEKRGGYSSYDFFIQGFHVGRLEEQIKRLKEI